MPAYEDPKGPKVNKMSSAKVKALKNFAMKDTLAKDKKGLDKAVDRKKKMDKYKSDLKINKMLPGYGYKPKKDSKGK
jgi:hypothetical protein